MGQLSVLKLMPKLHRLRTSACLFCAWVISASRDQRFAHACLAADRLATSRGPRGSTPSGRRGFCRRGPASYAASSCLHGKNWLRCFRMIFSSFWQPSTALFPHDLWMGRSLSAHQILLSGHFCQRLLAAGNSSSALYRASPASPVHFDPAIALILHHLLLRVLG